MTDHVGLPGYGKVWALGNPNLRGLLDGDVVVQEKVDGSQFSFGILNGELFCRSKGAPLDLDSPQQMFAAGVEYVKSVRERLVPGWVYRAEYLQKPKHNVLAYDRAPKNNITLFDVQTLNDEYMSDQAIIAIAEFLGVDAVPVLWYGRGHDLTEEKFKELISSTSYLGGQTVEGVVVKNRALRERFDGTLLKGKYVGEDFKEMHKREWKEISPGLGDIIEKIAAGLKSEARWRKSIQHLREAGQLKDDPKDIGPLMKDIQMDTGIECCEDIKQELWKWAWPKLQREVVMGFPQWYKEQLLKAQITNEKT